MGELMSNNSWGGIRWYVQVQKIGIYGA